jgi:regulator of replication initiation timing
MTGKKRDDDGHSYVQKVREDTRRYVEGLLADNEALRKLVASLESEKSRLLYDKMSLQEKALGLREELDRVRTDQEELRRRLSDARTESAKYSQQYVQVEERNNDLANLYVASYQLHSTFDRAEVVSAVQEIVINLIGSEEMALFELEEESGQLRLIGSFGIDEEVWKIVPKGEGLIGGAVEQGVSVLPGRHHGLSPTAAERGLTAAIPLQLGERVVGAVVVWGLLEHKGGLEDLDYELFDLLGTHAATALYVTR